MENGLRRTRDFSLAVRWVAGIVSVSGLLFIFLFQRVDWSSWILHDTGSSIRTFLINRAVRFVLNDIFAIGLVLALFGKRKFVIIAVYVQVFGLFFILLPYLVLKVNFPHYNGPLLSFLHRLILNPLLVYLLSFYFWYQEKYISHTTNREY